MYVSEALIFPHQILKQSLHYEHLWVEIITGNRTIAVHCLHRPPDESAENHSIFLTTAEHILNQLSDYEADAKII